MDLNSNSSDNLYWGKIEVDSENETSTSSPKSLDYSNKREPRLNWTSEQTMKLIETFEKDCKELWDVKHPCNKDRIARQAKYEYLASMFGTTAEEISRKIHNLRTQFNNELRKRKRRSADNSGGASSWEYFESLSFLIREPMMEAQEPDPLDGVEGLNIELAEFQANEEEQFSAVAAANRQNQSRVKRAIRVAASAPPPLPANPDPLMWNEEDYSPRLRPSLNPDECQIFGDFVASELRTLRSHESRKKLKRMIQKAILQVGEEEEDRIKNKGYKTFS